MISVVYVRCFNALHEALLIFAAVGDVTGEFFHMLIPCVQLPSVLGRCWLGGRKGIRPVKN